MPRLLLLLAVSTVCALGAGPIAAAPAATWTYVVNVDADLTGAEVTCDFTQYWPKFLVSDRPNTLAALSFPEAADGSRLLVRDGGAQIEPVFAGSARSVGYRVDLRALAAFEGRDRPAFRVGRDLALQPGALFLRPGRWPVGAQVRVRFELPESMRVATPWAPGPEPHTFTLPALATSLLGIIAIGRFTEDTITTHGTTIDIAVMDAPHKATREGIRAWITGAVRAVAGLYGRFPTPRLMALVHPVPGRSPPVVFGTAMRAGGGHIHLLLANAAADEDLPGEWIGVHEMVHLGMPWTFDSEAWLQEGFVTYYQEVLRARAGFLSEAEAWQRIDEGFGRGRRRGGAKPLELESRDMHAEHNYLRVYWAGAAVALLLDVELRRVSRGTRSLDDVMRYWHERYGDTRGPYRGVELLRIVDRWLGGALCERLAAACLARREFPDVEPAYAALGLRLRGGRIELDDAAPDAAIRRAIMQPATDPGRAPGSPDRTR